jgi:hypothetical protein
MVASSEVVTATYPLLRTKSLPAHTNATRFTTNYDIQRAVADLRAAMPKWHNSSYKKYLRAGQQSQTLIRTSWSSFGASAAAFASPQGPGAAAWCAGWLARCVGKTNQRPNAGQWTPFLFLGRGTLERGHDGASRPGLGDKLRGTENQKIHCGERHFFGALGVDFKTIKIADELP